MSGAIKSLREGVGEPVRLTQAQLDRFAQVHENFLNKAPRGRCMVAPFVRLQGLSLEWRNLSDADLMGACLFNANLRSAMFVGANLYCADLRSADATRADFSRADLRGVAIRGANLNRCIFDRADLGEAVLTPSNDLENLAVVRRAKGASGAGAINRDEIREPAAWAAARFSVDFSGASLVGTRLEGANLVNADFRGAVLVQARLGGADLDGADFSGAVLTGVNVARLRLRPEQLVGCVLDPTPEQEARAPVLEEAIARAELWWRTDVSKGSPAVVNEEDLRPVAPLFAGRSLTAMQARRTVAVGVNFAGAHLQGASFDGADLRGANFEGCDLRGASFVGANLTHAKFTDTRIEPLILGKGIARKTNFDKAVGLDRTVAQALNEGSSPDGSKPGG